MTFTRNISTRWHDEVPGARWFRADLHLHTLDDHPGGRLVRPASIGGGDPTAPETQHAYARAFLRSAVRQHVEVIGLTPHAVRAGPGDARSATWEIVKTWNEENDDDGVPFRDKIYAVFPGFEPSFTVGKRGGHLIFLFDPEVGRDFYLTAFTVVMDGATPWRDGIHQNSKRSAETAFEALDGLFDREGVPHQHHIVLAPHAFTGKGILNAVAGQVAGDFPWERLSALELPDNKTAEDMFDEKPWLRENLDKWRHGLFHSSDGYSLPPVSVPENPRATAAAGELGYRTTLLKLACPKVSAIRQAFLGRDSRVRLVYTHGGGGAFVERDDLPDPMGGAHPWIRSVKVTGGQSFFGKSADGKDGVEFRLSPSLNCIIGGRMSGKSTFLDGLRVHLGMSLPSEPSARSDVEGRAHKRFLLGDPSVEIHYGGTAAPGEWPAKFFTQRELQEAVKDQRGLRDILFHLAPDHTEELVAQQKELTTLDGQLAGLASKIAVKRSDAADATQALQEAREAKEALCRYEEVGAGRLGDMQTEIGRVESYRKSMQDVASSVEAALVKLREADLPADEDRQVRPLMDEQTVETVRQAVGQIAEKLGTVSTDLDSLLRRLLDIEAAGHDHEVALKDEITAALVAAGGSREDLLAFDRYQARAANYEVLRAQETSIRGELEGLERSFESKVARRKELVDRHRTLIAELARSVAGRFGGQIQVRLEPEGVLDPLEEWLRNLRQKGVTRWWNTQRETGDAPGATELYAKLTNDRLKTLGMSDDVASTFAEVMTADVRFGLRAIRCPDKYVLEWRVSELPLEFREMSELSGGQQVSLLLTLLLQAEDDRPIVIDQPEDELDSQYLFGTILPVLRDLKGRRQIIFATHDANIVVNGDADHVICLDADHKSGCVRIAGAIEIEDVRTAIVDTVDGGSEAFQLRRRKYGF